MANPLQINSFANGYEVVDPFNVNQMARRAALLRDAGHGRSVTKPRVATELSKYALCTHESSHCHCLPGIWSTDYSGINQSDRR